MIPFVFFDRNQNKGKELGRQCYAFLGFVVQKLKLSRIRDILNQHLQASKELEDTYVSTV